MKYYHLIGFSALLTAIQFTLQSFLGLELPSIIQKVFVGMQATLLVGYSLLFLVYVIKRKKKVHKEKRPNVVTIKKQTKEARSYSKAS
ncbi:hypothetical protein C7H83_12340 [Tetragenococcus halophilus]|uniref:Uncharacterized protein n=1 Tax=Tetragenococcus halophilus TaxID=51669 RepID=A0A3G5FLJ2_TETHA|nr:hypothetical protein [Tetragenococcus halophilus]AYW51194.1 hypothetical protein C7H83_12340 [Tetragenococcus halophilus]GBD62797.1 putative uncharacterized protein [Tetragenococcus halophilus subsp. flandriensis]